MHTYGFHSCKRLSGPPLQLPAGVLTTQPGGFAGGKPAGDVFSPARPFHITTEDVLFSKALEKGIFGEGLQFKHL